MPITNRPGLMNYSSFNERKMRLARRAKKSDPDFLHAQLVLSGQTVTRDTIANTSHYYYFDCGCVRAFHLGVPLAERETLKPCQKHVALQALVRPARHT